jgi:repressor LexA
MPVTKRQKEIVAFIQEYTEQQGRSPTRSEIAKHFGFSSLGTVQRHLDRLVAYGLVARNRYKRRSLEAVSAVPLNAPDSQSEPMAVVPLLGLIRAGSPVESFPVSDLLDVPRWLLADGEHFALRVAGDSMAGEGILDGDIVLVHRTTTPRQGDVVVALVKGEATVKRYHPLNGNVVELRPSSPGFLPIRVRPLEDNLLIQGVVVSVIRKL